jgi:hypothetical protein
MLLDDVAPTTQFQQVMGAPGATSGASAAAGAAPPPMQLGWQMPSPGPVASSAPATRTASGRAQPHYFIPDGGSSSNSSNENKQQEQQQQVARAPSGGKGDAGTGAGPSEGISTLVGASRPGSSVAKGGLPNFTTNNPLAGVLPHPEGHREGNKGPQNSPPVAPGLCVCVCVDILLCFSLHFSLSLSLSLCEGTWSTI